MAQVYIKQAYKYPHILYANMTQEKLAQMYFQIRKSNVTFSPRDTQISVCAGYATDIQYYILLFLLILTPCLILLATSNDATHHVANI